MKILSNYSSYSSVFYISHLFRVKKPGLLRKIPEWGIRNFAGIIQLLIIQSFPQFYPWQSLLVFILWTNLKISRDGKLFPREKWNKKEGPRKTTKGRRKTKAVFHFLPPLRGGGCGPSNLKFKKNQKVCQAPLTNGKKRRRWKLNKYWWSY